MGKQSNNITYVSQDQFNKDLDESLNILIEDGADDKTIKLYIDDYKSRFAVKKKDGTKPNSTSTSVSQKQVSEQTNGSSGSQEFEYKPVYDERGREVKIKNKKGELVPYMEKVPKGFASSTEEREIVRQEQKQKASKPIVSSSNLKKYQESTKVSDEEKATLQKEVNDEFDKKGFWNGIADGAKKGFNFLADTFTTIGTFGTETEASKSVRMETDSFAKENKQAEQELIASKQPITPEAIAEKAKEIRLNKKIEGLVVDKNNKFLSELSPEEIKSLNLERVKQYKTLSDKDKYIATQAEILKNNFEKDTKDYTTAVAIIKKNKEQGIETNQALIDFAIEKENSLKEKFNEVKKLESEYISNKENIGSAEEEIDFLKRNYDTADKVKTLAKIGFGDIYNTVANKLPLMVSDLDQSIFEPLRPGSSEGILSDDERQELIDKSIDWETAKELAKSNVKKDVDFENLSLSNFGQFFAQELATQIPVFAQMAMPGGIVSIGMTSAFEKYGRMEQESNNISFEFNGKQFSGFEKENGEILDSLGNTYDPKEVNITSIRESDKSTANKFFTSATFGMAEAVLGAMPTKNIFGRALNSLSTSGERTLFRQSVKEFVKAKGTGVLNDTATEVVSEGATQIIQNIADISSGKKDVSIYDGVDHAMVSAGMLSFLMSATPAVAGLALKPFSESKENKQVNENLQEIFALQSQLNNTELSSISKTTIENKIKDLEKSNSDVLDNIASRTKGISKETFDAIKDVNKKQELLILQASEISKDNNLDTEIKKKIIADLESEFNSLETKRNKLASGKSTILDALSDNESARLKEKAANLLLNEEKAKGKTDEEINFTEEQINKKAIEIYNQNAVQQEATTTETKQEAQPQAEIQKTEQEVLNEEIKYKVPALLPKKYNPEGDNILMTESELELLDAKAEKIIENPREDVSDRIRIQQGNAFTIQDLDAIEQFFKARREGKETRSFSEWRKNTKNETAPSQVDNVDGNVQPGNNVVEPNGITEQENNQASNIQPADNSRNVEKEKITSKKEDNIIIEGDDLILKHGTPHNFDQFQLEKIGTGEGAQAFGYGLYFTDGSKIAESYAKKLSEDKTGIVYTVRIKNGRTSNWADWREPLNQEQEEVLYNSLTKEERAIYQEHLEKAFYPDSPKYDMKYEKEYHGTFDDLRTDKDGFASYEKQSAAGLIYMDLKDAFGQEKATEILKRSGIDGIRYKAKRGYGQETNYVVFNPESISIESKSNEKNKLNQSIIKREIKIADKGQSYTVEKTDLGLVITDKKGNTPSKVTERKILDEYSKTINFTQGTRVDDSFESSAETYIDDVATKSQNPSEIAEAIAYVENADMNDGKVDPIQIAIANALGEKSVEKSSFTNINDRNNINQSIALQYFAQKGKGKGLDQIAMEVEYEVFGDYNANNPRITEEDIANFIVDNPRGAIDFLNKNRNEALEKLKTAFTSVTGLPAKPQFIQKAIDQQIELKNQLFAGNSLYALSEEDLLSLDNDYQQFKQFENNEQQQEAINETPEARVDIKNTAQRGKESGVQETRGIETSGKSNESGSSSKSSMVEGLAENEAINRTTEASNSGGSTGAILSIEEREVTPEEKPSSLDEKIEKDKLSDVLDWLDGLKLDPNDLNATLPFLPQSWNMFIEAVKLAVKAGKTINDAIQEAIKKLQSEGIGNDEINAIVEKFTGQAVKKVESGTFERKAGKKSLLSRVYEGENKEPLNSIIEDIGLDYKVENQEQAQNRAKKFVKQVGINKALEAVRNNLIKGAEKAFVYAEILDQIVELSESANIDEIGKIQEDYNVILEESLNAFDEEARDAGRFISALNRIYNNSKVRYNLTKQINQYKALNKGVIDEETLIKFNEADRKLKEIEQKLKEAEAKLIEQEQQLAIKNIEEAIAREIKNKVSNKTKATKIANQIRRAKIQKPDVFNASTGASLVWDGAVEIVAKSIEAGGTIADAVYKGVEYIKNTDWYKNATKDIQKKAIDSFVERMVSDSVEQTSSISISEDGKIRIPESVVKDYVRQGITDINEISQRIIDDFFSGNEDVTIRDVRDAITRYGKTINQSKDEINAKVRELKRLGKLISAMEDVLEGKRPLKSGLQRDKPTQVEREMMRELKDKMRDLPLDEADLEIAWKNALDTYKQRLKNQIEDLEKQIDNKEKSKVKRESVKLDEEAKALKEQVKVLRETLNNLVGKPELTEEQKINRATRQLENAIDNLTNQIANGELDYKDKPTPVNSARLTELRKQKDALIKQLQKAREESGIVEKRRLKQAKQRLKNQIELYQKKIQNKDFSKKEPKPLPADIELQQLQAEKIKWQEVYDKAKYEAELRDRKWQDYARELLVGIIGLPRLLMAGGEMSMVFIQGGIQTLSLATRNPKALAKIFAKAFISIGSNEKFLEYERAIKSDSNYMLMKNSKLALTETDYQMELREETFIGSNIVYGTWNAIGKGIEIGAVKILGKKDFPTIGSTFISMIKKDIETKKIPISEQFKNLNPLLAFERGNTIYMNEIRKARFMDGVKMLKMEGKNEIDHKEDFKTLAKAINTLTGRTSIGRLENINDYLSIIFFSFKNTISVFQQLNPWFYSYVLRNNYDEWTKPSVAQKIAVRDMVNFVTITTSMMFLLQAAAGDDEEGNPVVEIEKDPRSSDFMTLKIKGKDKDTRFDPWHGMKPQVVFFARSITGEQKGMKKGKVEIKRIGLGYKADTHWDNMMKTYLYNKFSPSMQMVYKQMNSEVDKQGNKTYYGKDFQERFSLTPMYIESLREIEEQDPDAFTRFLAALGFFGLNSSTY